MLDFCRSPKQGILLLIGLTTSLAFAQPGWGAPTTNASDLDSTNATPKTQSELISEIRYDERTMNALLGHNNAALKDPTGRKELVPKLIPVIHHMSGVLDQLAAGSPRSKPQVLASQVELAAILAVLGDKSAADEMKAQSGDKEAVGDVRYQSEQLLERWYLADNTAAAQTNIVDDIQKLDQSHADSVMLTLVTMQISGEASTPELKNRMLGIATEKMTNPAAQSIKHQLAAKKEEQSRQEMMLQKPLTLAGNLPDGKPFSTADLKGKVILVDFWGDLVRPVHS